MRDRAIKSAVRLDPDLTPANGVGLFPLTDRSQTWCPRWPHRQTAGPQASGQPLSPDRKRDG